MEELGKNKKITSNSVSLAGEFAVLSQLALRGFDANMTLGHTKGVDILVSNPETGKMYKLEVKTTFKDSREKPSASKTFGDIVSSWMMGAKHEDMVDPDLFYCFVNIGKDTSVFKFYIVPNEVVSKYVKEQHKLWLDEDPARKNGDLRTFRIGLEKSIYKIPTPTAEKYENNWEFKK